MFRKRSIPAMQPNQETPALRGMQCFLVQQSEHNAHASTRRFPTWAYVAMWRVGKIALALRIRVEGYKCELGNFVHRIRQRSQRGDLLVRLGPVLRLDSSGQPQPCIRTRDCSASIQSYAASHPWTTVFDWEIYRMGWEAGAKWGESNLDSCRSVSNESA
jgi:hypothetical protein